MNDSELGDTADFQLPAAIAHPRRHTVAVEVDAAGQSDRGKVRPNNEDHFLLAKFGRSLEPVQTNLSEADTPVRFQEFGHAMVVADGLGGSAAGEVASKLAICTLFELALATPDWIFRTEDDWLEQELMRRADVRFEQVNRTLSEHARIDPKLVGFGTTMTFAMNRGTQLLIAHVGDSRAYCLRRGKLQRLTRDHTFAQMEADLGHIDQKDVATHRLRHALTKVLGDNSASSEPDVRISTVGDGDSLLLCTDGLTEMVPDDKIRAILAHPVPAKQACQMLVDAALAAGGRDNVTVIVARYQVPDE